MAKHKDQACPECWLIWAHAPRDRWKVAIEIHVHISNDQANKMTEILAETMVGCSLVATPANQTPTRKP